MLQIQQICLYFHVFVDKKWGKTTLKYDQDDENDNSNDEFYVQNLDDEQIDNIYKRGSKDNQQMSKTKQVLNDYLFNANKPKVKYSNLEVFDAKHKETALDYTIKIIKKPDVKLEEYLKKIKDIHSDNVIKIIEFAYEISESRMVIIQEHVGYGTLKKALAKCKRFDDDDSVFISKMILNGHIDLLRGGVTWFGDENDIEFTEGGLKLSWNNSMNFTEKTPIPDLLTRIGIRQSTSSILPFPKNKPLNDLIAVSKQNASQISLHPLVKKKQKSIKKKGRGWIAIKENKIKGQYFQQVTLLGISQEFGLVRIKVLEIGDISEQLFKIHQTIASFVKILDYYEDKGSLYTITEYANDGTVQNYVKKLKTANMQLKESQIQFFFYSVIQPLKIIHHSEVVSLNILHIRNIYIQNGIPKIGQPIPMNERLRQVLMDRSDVPDFYHKDFKKEPSTKNSIFDTYSLGVLLYKLMYTEYPIFPKNEVHIPTAPTYKKNLKSALQLFLNVGGDLEELQKQLEISDDVKNEVSNNQKILEQMTKKNKKQLMIEEQNKVVEDSELEFREERNKQQDKNATNLQRFWTFITTRGKDPKGKYSTLHNSQFNMYRKCVTVTVILLFYVLAFFLIYLNGTINLLSYSRLFTPYSVNILGQYHQIITPNFDEFIETYNQHKNGSILVLNETLHCKIDDNLAYYDFVRPQSPHWTVYLIFSILAMITILTLKGIQLCKYSTVTVGFHHYDTTISGSNASRFALSTYVYFQLWFCFALYSFYYLFNYPYHEQHLPCFGGTNWTQLTKVLMLDRMKFSTNYLIIICISFFMGVISFSQIVHYQKIKYNLLLNPIFVYTAPYLILFIMMRIGGYGPFVPSFSQNSQGIIGSSYMATIGYFPELLMIVQIPVCLLIDHIFYIKINERLHKFVVEQTHSTQLKLDK